MITEEDKAKMAAELDGTSGIYIHQLADSFNVSEDEIREYAAEQGVEECAACGWYCQNSEFDEDGNCEDCSEKKEEE